VSTCLLAAFGGLLASSSESRGERVKAAAEELERLGIASPNGTRIRADLPQDMQEGADRDFGG
jgi:hypothetical protein